MVPVVSKNYQRLSSVLSCLENKQHLRWTHNLVCSEILAYHRVIPVTVLSYVISITKLDVKKKSRTQQGALGYERYRPLL